MSSHLTDNDKERLREAFRLRHQHEKMLKKEHDLCFIESLLNIESQESEGINLSKTEFHLDNETSKAMILWHEWILILYYCLLLSELFSYSVVW